MLLYTAYDISSIVIRLVMLCYIPQKHTPSAATAWLLAVYFWPWPGFLLYSFFGSATLPEKRTERHEKMLLGLEEGRRSFRCLFDDEAHWLPEDLVRFGALGRKLGDMCVTRGNEFLLIEDEKEFIRSLSADIDGAKETVHLLFYIFARDRMTEPLFRSIEAAVARGVKCRVLVDALGAKSFLKRDAKALRERGVRVEKALPPKLFRRTPTTARYDLRNHRKIAVIDGCVGYTGSHNVIEPSYGGKAGGLEWKDLTLCLRGPVVLQLQGVFLEDWFVETGELLETSEAFPVPELTGDAVVQTVPSGPSYPWQNYQRLVVSALHGARKWVVITTPYLIPDDELLHALETAVLGGVRVQLVIPEKSDQFLVGNAAKAYYGALLDSGVEIYLFSEGILHSKTMTVDHDLAFLGTSNFDIRSFALNFELNLVLYGRGETEAVRKAQHAYIASSRRLTREEWGERPTVVRVIHGITKLFSPLL
ncbi:MAG: cardiolipin synthase [Synergistaceae bacterium]|nr:cardiolipin synthase [Synergistaceae bacterium]